MPRLLTNGEKPIKQQILDILDGTSAETWQKDADRLCVLAARL